MKECLDPQISDAPNSRLANQMADKSQGADGVTSQRLEQAPAEQRGRGGPSFQQRRPRTQQMKNQQHFSALLFSDRKQAPTVGLRAAKKNTQKGCLIFSVFTGAICRCLRGWERSGQRHPPHMALNNSCLSRLDLLHRETQPSLIRPAGWTSPPPITHIHPAAGRCVGTTTIIRRVGGDGGGRER